MTSSVAVLTVVDTTPPVVTLNGSAMISLLQGAPFTDPGAVATDTCAGSLPVTTNGSVNVNVGGIYHISYVATDPSHNSATNTRTVVVQGTSGPPFILVQPSNQVVQCDSSATFSVIASGGMPLHYQWYDGESPLSDGPEVSGSTSRILTLSGTMLSQAGNYTVLITNSLNSAISQGATLTVNDKALPFVTVIGSAAVSTVQGALYTDPGATAAERLRWQPASD